jgi:hypothetical protein
MDKREQQKLTPLVKYFDKPLNSESLGSTVRVYSATKVAALAVGMLRLILFETFVECLARYSQAESSDGLVAV